MNYDFVTIGGVTEDICFYTNEGEVIKNKLVFDYDSKIKAENIYSFWGGGASNASVCLSRLGFRVAGIFAVGDDERGKNILDNLKKEKVNVDFYQKIKKKISGFSFLVIKDRGEHICFLDRGANQSLRLGRKELKFMKSSEWIHLSSLSGNWMDVLKKIFAKNDYRISWNPGREQIDAGAVKLKKFLKQTDILSVNKNEAEELLKTKSNSVKKLLKILKEFGPGIVIITNGYKGTNIYDGNNFYFQDIIKNKKEADTTGVGDAFNSSFVAGIKMYNGDIKKAMLLAAKNASSVTGKMGAHNGLIFMKHEARNMKQ